MFGPAPLVEIHDYTLDALEIAAAGDYDRGKRTSCTVHVAFRADRAIDDLHRFRVMLDCRFEADQAEGAQPNLPYAVHVVTTGQFSTPRDLPPNGISFPSSVVVNALMILYGIARGIVGQATAAGERGKYVLPSMTFQHLVENAASMINDIAPEGGMRVAE